MRFNRMFLDAKSFNQNLDSWDISSAKSFRRSSYKKRELYRLKSPFTDMFKDSAMENNLPKWFKKA
ncbi:BspA family leucine-rich repeat surface protein [Helicobacter sp. 23-1044]